MYKLLYICTHNRCRSILSEAITNHYSNGLVHAESAGCSPCGAVHPLSLKYLVERDISIEGLRSQAIDEFEYYDPDIVITVCDSAARESCPIWFGDALRLHWGLPDPSKIENIVEAQSAFYQVISEIRNRTLAINALAKAQYDIQIFKDKFKKMVRKSPFVTLTHAVNNTGQQSFVN